MRQVWAYRRLRIIAQLVTSVLFGFWMKSLLAGLFLWFLLLWVMTEAEALLATALGLPHPEDPE
jgi:hypothetical protein